jgi:hypothetical protein
MAEFRALDVCRSQHVFMHGCSRSREVVVLGDDVIGDVGRPILLDGGGVEIRLPRGDGRGTAAWPREGRTARKRWGFAERIRDMGNRLGCFAAVAPICGSDDQDNPRQTHRLSKPVRKG